MKAWPPIGAAQFQGMRRPHLQANIEPKHEARTGLAYSSLQPIRSTPHEPRGVRWRNSALDLKQQRPATHAGGPKRKPTAKKIYAVGLEIICPGGACGWAPEIPSTVDVAGFMPHKYELVHISAVLCKTARAAPVPSGMLANGPEHWRLPRGRPASLARLSPGLRFGFKGPGVRSLIPLITIRSEV